MTYVCLNQVSDKCMALVCIVVQVLKILLLIQSGIVRPLTE
jgi:hypothetical protein